MPLVSPNASVLYDIVSLEKLIYNGSCFYVPRENRVVQAMAFFDISRLVRSWIDYIPLSLSSTFMTI